MLLRESLLTYSRIVWRNCTRSNLYRLVKQFCAWETDQLRSLHQVDLIASRGRLRRGKEARPTCILRRSPERPRCPSPQP